MLSSNLIAQWPPMLVLSLQSYPRYAPDCHYKRTNMYITVLYNVLKDTDFKVPRTSTCTY